MFLRRMRCISGIVAADSITGENGCKRRKQWPIFEHAMNSWWMVPGPYQMSLLSYYILNLELPFDRQNSGYIGRKLAMIMEYILWVFD